MYRLSDLGRRAKGKRERSAIQFPKEEGKFSGRPLSLVFDGHHKIAL